MRAWAASVHARSRGRLSGASCSMTRRRKRTKSSWCVVTALAGRAAIAQNASSLAASWNDSVRLARPLVSATTSVQLVHRGDEHLAVAVELVPNLPGDRDLGDVAVGRLDLDRATLWNAGDHRVGGGDGTPGAHDEQPAVRDTAALVSNVDDRPDLRLQHRPDVFEEPRDRRVLRRLGYRRARGVDSMNGLEEPFESAVCRHPASLSAG